jgi:hypothetical protein
MQKYSLGFAGLLGEATLWDVRDFRDFKALAPSVS